jgi:hypothetical protein
MLQDGNVQDVAMARVRIIFHAAIVRMVGLLCGLSGGIACAQQPAPTVRVESLVLYRSACFGTCPVYSLSIRANGRITFVQGDSVKTDSIGKRDVAQLFRAVESIGFYKYSPDIMRDHDVCPIVATDASSVTVTIYRSDSTFRVKDYLGCFLRNDLSIGAPLSALRHFERQIDSVAHSERWVRPSRFP